MDWATPMRPALVPTRGRQRDAPRQSDPPPPTPQGPSTAPQREGGTPTPPPPPGHPPARGRAWRQGLTHQQPTRGGGTGADAVGARAHTHAKSTRGEPEGQSDRARGTHRPHGMAYRRARIRDSRTRRSATRSKGNAGTERGTRERHRNRHRPQPPGPAASAAHTRPGHCTRQGSSTHRATHQPHG